jgi:peptidoglycan/LPS O-acetylase OafA/YrhL
MNATEIEITAKQSKKNEWRLLEIDGLRGIACTFVVIFHYSKYLHKNYDLSWQFSYGVTGVDLFFIISGFVIYMSLTKTNKISEFVISRFSRLFPVYWFAVTLTTILCIIFSYNVSIITLRNYLGNLTMMPLYTGSPNIDNSYWTLLVELEFYVLISFFYFYNKTISVFNKSLLVLAAMIVLNAACIFMHHGQKVIQYIPILSFWNLFLTGMIFYKMMHENSSKISFYLIIVLNLAVVFFTHDQAGFSRFYLSPLQHLICVFLYIGLFYLIINKRLTFLRNKAIVFLGAISYSTYLIHQTIGYILIDELEKVIKNSTVCLFAALTGILCLSFIINKYIERPSMKYFKTLLTKKATTNLIVNGN